MLYHSRGFLDYLPAPPGQAKIFYTTSVGLPAKPKYFTLPPRASRRHRPLSKVVKGHFRPRAFFSVRPLPGTGYREILRRFLELARSLKAH